MPWVAGNSLKHAQTEPPFDLAIARFAATVRHGGLSLSTDSALLCSEPDSRSTARTPAQSVGSAAFSIARAVPSASRVRETVTTRAPDDALAGIGRVPTIAHSWISTRPATAAEARLLGLAGPEPLLVERRIIYDSDSVQLAHTESAYVANRDVIDAGIRRLEHPSTGGSGQ